MVWGRARDRDGGIGDGGVGKAVKYNGGHRGVFLVPHDKAPLFAVVGDIPSFE